MNWSQISIGAVAGAIGTWLLQIIKLAIDHFFEERKERRAEQRTIRAERREQDRKEAERKQAAAEKLEHDRAELIRLVTELSGCTDFVFAARVVKEIHQFFHHYPLYLNQHNRAFLVKYPVDLTDRAAYDVHEDDDTTTLDELKRESMLLETTV